MRTWTAVSALAGRMDLARVEQCPVLGGTLAFRPRAPSIIAGHRHPNTRHISDTGQQPRWSSITLNLIVTGPQRWRSLFQDLALHAQPLVLAPQAGISGAWSACGTGTGLSGDAGAGCDVGAGTACLVRPCRHPTRDQGVVDAQLGRDRHRCPACADHHVHHLAPILVCVGAGLYSMRRSRDPLLHRIPPDPSLPVGLHGTKGGSVRAYHEGTDADRPEGA